MVDAGFGLALALLGSRNDSHHFVVTARGGDSEGTGRIPMGIDTLVGVGAEVHQQLDDFGGTVEDGVMQDLEIVHGHPGEFGTDVEHRAHLREVAGSDCADQPFDGEAANPGCRVLHR